MSGNIFSKYFLTDFVQTRRKGLRTEIDKLEITEMTDIVQLVTRLKSQYTIAPLVLKDPIPSEPRETTVDRQNHFREFYRQKVYEIMVRVPFEGNRDLFDCHPSSSTVIYLGKNVSIGNNSIMITIILENLDADKYQAELGKIIGDLSCNIPRVNAEISPWNGGLETEINQLLEHRKGLVSKKFDFMEKIGLSVNQKSNDFMVPTPVAKKIIPTPVSETAKNVQKENIPILQNEVYNDIKEVLYNVGKAIERKPSLYLKKHEEDLRDIFLLFLETRYDSTSGVGEAFNKKGKTDILLKYAQDGTNLFVAECKFWKGQKKTMEAIDQLLGYLTHRDSKTALMIFVDQKELSSIIQTIKSEIVSHPNFKRYIKDNYESSISYEFSLPSDSQKIIQIEVMLFHFPK